MLGDAKPLLPVLKLSDIFSDAPEERHLHVVANLPSTSECAHVACTD